MSTPASLLGHDEKRGMLHEFLRLRYRGHMLRSMMLSGRCMIFHGSLSPNPIAAIVSIKDSPTYYPLLILGTLKKYTVYTLEDVLLQRAEDSSITVETFD